MDKLRQKALKGTSFQKRKHKRRLPDLGALSSLVSFEGPEEGNSAREGTDRPDNEASRSRQGVDHSLTRIESSPYPPSTLTSSDSSNLRKTLSQDWLKTSFSPRPGRDRRRTLIWGSTRLPSNRLLSNTPSLRSIPEEDELDRDEGSEFSDDHVLPETVAKPICTHAPCSGMLAVEGGIEVADGIAESRNGSDTLERSGLRQIEW